MIDLTWNDIKEHVCKNVTKRCSLQNSQMRETDKKKVKLSKKLKDLTWYYIKVHVYRKVSKLCSLQNSQIRGTKKK